MTETRNGLVSLQALHDEIETLREENRQLRNLTAPELPPQFSMTQGEWRLVYLILRNSPITKERLYELYYWGHENPPDPKGLSVLMYRARKKLMGHGVDILTIGGWGFEATWDDRWSGNPLLQFQKRFLGRSGLLAEPRCSSYRSNLEAVRFP